MTGRRLLVAAAALAIALLVPAVAPRVARACDCVPPQPLAAYAEEAAVVIFSGLVDGRAARGVHVRVDRWFDGAGAAPDLWISGDFGDGASCGTGAEPPVGTRWLWVAWRAQPRDDVTIMICYPFGDLATPEGQALLAEAVVTFGDGAPPTATPTAPGGGEGTKLDPLPIAALAVVAALGAMVLGGAVLAARRQRSG